MELRDTLLQIEEELNGTYLEREEVVRGLLVGAVARAHVLLLGPPGTAKSALAADLCSRIGGTYFSWLLTRFSTPEELFGPVSLRALEQDSYRRITTGKLPEAHIAFLDEVFKANSAVLNAMLGILNERRFHNDGQAVPVPLILAVGASNELPEDREELGALWDRFLLRYQVTYLSPSAFERMLGAGGGQTRRTTLPLEALEEAQRQASQVRLNGILAALAELRSRLQAERIVASDRRWRASLDVLRAQAWLEGRDHVAEDDLAILQHVLWQEPPQAATVRHLVLAIANPLVQEATELLDQARQVHAEAMEAVRKAAAGDEKVNPSAIGLEAHKKLRNAIRRLQDLRAQCEARGRDSARIVSALEQAVQLGEEVLRECLGLKA
jgi:MoxR-like ATPase